MIIRGKAHHAFLVGFLLSISFPAISQDQKIADSLAKVYEHVDPEDSSRFDLLRNLAFNEVNNLSLALQYAEELIELSRRKGNDLYLFRGYLNKGNKKRLLGDLDEALEAYITSLDAAKKAVYIEGQGAAYCAIADVYTALNNHEVSISYYNKAIAVIKLSNDSIHLASVILNAGDEYLTHHDYDSALLYFLESKAIFEKIGYPAGKAYALGNLGMVYANIKENKLAEEYINEAILIQEKSNDYYPICFYLISMADIYLANGNSQRAISYASRSLKLAEQYKLKQQISDANLKLSELYEQIGRPEKSFEHYKSHIAYRDSVNNIETVQKIADLRTGLEVSLREKEIGLLEQQQTLNMVYILIAIILLVFAIVVLLYFRQRFHNARLMANHERIMQDEKIENLLKEQESRALQSLVVGREEERKRIAQDLHNHLGSLLATVKVNLNAVSEQDIPNYHTITSLVDQACSDVRNMSHSLNMGISDNFGLVPALRDLAAHLQHAGNIAVEFNASMQECRLDPESEIVLYRIVQELVSNVLKHAHATNLSILLTCFAEENLVNIIVHDNGKGFETLIENSDGGMGIESIRRMVAQRSGEINFDSNPASGTTVNIDLPILNSSGGL